MGSSGPIVAIRKQCEKKKGMNRGGWQEGPKRDLRPLLLGH